MNNRQNLRKPILSRIYFIDREIASGRYPNVHHLAKAYEVGTATIYRDIEYMKYTLDAPIEYSAKNRGWYYSEKTFRLPARFAAATASSCEFTFMSRFHYYVFEHYAQTQASHLLNNPDVALFYKAYLKRFFDKWHITGK